MEIQLLADGTLLVPYGIYDKVTGAVGHGEREVKPGAAEYAELLALYRSRQEV